ncbi:MAG: hypothetical protein ABH879_09570 [archaeon]
MLNISIPQMHREEGNAKDLVFSILTLEQPLSIIELMNRVHRQYNTAMTYQAVRKAVRALAGQGVLRKEGRKYSIKKEWILEVKGYFDTLLAKYSDGKHVSSFTASLGRENYAVYTFSTLLEVDNFWGDMMWYWADHIGENEDKEFVGYCYYHWWYLINLGRETRLYSHLLSKGISCHHIFPLDLPLNRWSAKLYGEVGVHVKLSSGREMDAIDDFVDVNILGDTVIQVKYPKSVVEELRRFYVTYKSTQEMSMKEVAKIVHATCDVKFITFRNPVIAKNLRHTYKRMLR